MLQDVKPTIAELQHQQDQHATAAAAYPLTVVVPPEIILRTAFGEHVLDTRDKGTEESKDKDRVGEGIVRLLLTFSYGLLYDKTIA